MRVALIQHTASVDPELNFERGLSSVRKAAEQGAQLVAFPELAFVRFFPQHPRRKGMRLPSETVPGPTTDRLSRLAKQFGVVVVFNLFEEASHETFNSSPVIDADGSLLGVTRMVHIMDGPGFHERDYYHPGDRGAPVYSTAVGRIGVAICYDRHFPEYMRALGVKNAELIVLPQAGVLDEWPPGLYEAELQVASMQNGYFCALANRVGLEEQLRFAGESFVTAPDGQVIARAPAGEECILYADADFDLLSTCPARRHFFPDRKPGLYPL